MQPFHYFQVCCSECVPRHKQQLLINEVLFHSFSSSPGKSSVAHGTLSNTLISPTLVLAPIWGHLVGAAILAKKDDGP